MAKRTPGRWRTALSRAASRPGSGGYNSTPEPRPRSAENLVGRLMGVTGWETMSPIDLAKRLGVTSLELTQVRQLILYDRARPRGREDAASS